jgi:DNA-binding response OmpR family regulator
MVSHILIIDDPVNLPRFIAMELRAEGYQVSLSCNNSTEPAIIQELRSDLIVLNWEMRRKSGANVYHQLRLIDSQVPIVVVTVKDESSCHLVLQGGAQACLTKPFSMNDLSKTIKYYLKSEKVHNKAHSKTLPL